MNNRRDFLRSSAAISAAAVAGCTSPDMPPNKLVEGSLVFPHGVASGDPLNDRVVFWTRVARPQAVEVVLSIFRDPQLTALFTTATASTAASRDFTVKLDVAGLEPDTTYYYQFSALGERSPIGRTRTLPDTSTDKVRLAFCSCSQMPRGYFNAYRHMAARADLNAVLHLGDYIYEYGATRYEEGTSFYIDSRLPSSPSEIVSLEDYRQRYAEYRLDVDLQAVHRQHPMICVWDDHEFTNNNWKDGAANHNPEDGEGDWPTRENAARQAYYEWLPIREQAPFENSINDFRHFRQFKFGDLVNLLMLDTRVNGRDEQSSANRDVEGRSILGTDQLNWLQSKLSETDCIWRVLGQQVIFSARLNFNFERSPISSDAWDGYRPERQILLDHVRENLLDNLVVLTGDVHSSWAFDIHEDPNDTTHSPAYVPGSGEGAAGVEVVTPGVTSTASQRDVNQMMTANPHLHYYEDDHLGYVLLNIEREQMQAEWWHVVNVADPLAEETLANVLIVEEGSNRYSGAGTESPAINEPALAP